MRHLTRLIAIPILLMLLTLASLAGCGPAAQAAPTATVVPTQGEPDTALPTSTAAPTSTTAPAPTDTPEPSATPTEAPTETPEATATSTAELAGETAAPTIEPTAGDEEPAADSFAPANTQVWQLDDLPYNTASEPACGGDYPFNFYGLVGITPNGDRLTWKRQDGTANLSFVSLNNYFGQIPAFLPDYDLQIAVSFTSPTTLIVSYKLVSLSNTDCTHTYDYRAAYAWDG